LHIRLLERPGECHPADFADKKRMQLANFDAHAFVLQCLWSQSARLSLKSINRRTPHGMLAHPLTAMMRG
jgi:hypothetical protein